MSSDQNPIEPIASAADAVTGWSHLSKTALPLIGQVGAVIGGVFSMLAAFQKISGELVTAVEGFVIVVAAVASGIVVFYRHSTVVADQKKNVFGYPYKARVAAAVVLAISGFLLIIFLGRLWNDANAASITPTPTARQTLAAGVVPTRLADRRVTPTLPPPTVTQTTAPSATATSTVTTKTQTPMPLPVEQITDVNLLIKMGNDALSTRHYQLAVSYLTRATFVEATNAQAQFGLGQAYFYQNNLNSAQEPFQIALRLNPNYHDAHAYLGWIYDYHQDKARAIAEYDVFLKAAPRDDPLRPDIADRMKQLTSGGIAPTLTPIGQPTTLPTPTATK